MTADRRAALVERVAKAMWDGYDKPFATPLYHARRTEAIRLATAAVSLIRAEVLEESAQVADRYEIPLCETAASHIAAAIRALKGGT
jgi:hypothetical protein